MYAGLNLKAPFFEIGPKAYLYGKELLEYAKAVDRISKKYDVQIILTPQCVDIPKIAQETDNLLVFAQHMDSLEPGRGIGSILPEAIKEAGAVGVMLNHAEKRLTLTEIYKTIKRADEIGLATLVCADSPAEASAIAQLGPNIILAKPAELIGTSTSVGRGNDFIPQSIKMIKGINPKIHVLNSAGIQGGDDIAEIVRLGAEATGSTSGILKAADPVQKTEEMIKALRQTWDQLNN